ncbi:flagellin [Oscillospiraceae bacterium 50-16]
MRIQHNIMAMNAYRNYNNNASALSKNLEKLSSGYKINRAGDDAAGLAISEKMRAQITGLNAAQKNVKDGISLVKTAEGAMQEIQDMLNRMDYLATQSANGTYQDEVDRENLQKEVNQLLDEIDRIADSANFNGIKLLDGSLDANASVGAVNRTAVELTDEINRQTGVTQAVTASFEIDLEGMVFNGGTSGAGTIQLTVGGATMTVSINGGTTGSAFEVNASGGATIGTATTQVVINGATYGVSVSGSKLTFTAATSNYSGSTASLDVSNIRASVNTTTSNPGIGTVKPIQQGSSAWNTAAQNTVDGVRTSPQIEAQGKFTLTADMIESGEIVIDGTTYKFDKETNLADSSGQTIGIKDWDAASTDTAKNTNAVADRLVAALSSNSNFSFGHTNATITVQAKTGTAENYTEGKYHDDATKLTESGWSKNLVSYGESKAAVAGQGLQLQIGDTSDSYNQLVVKVGDMHRGALNLNGLNIGTATAASGAIEKIKNAINYVSGVRGDLGATQNRLEHTQNNLSVMAENIQDAESTIRDTDVAEEMMSYVKNNILVQSAQAMLAQANHVPQGVLQLLG